MKDKFFTDVQIHSYIHADWQTFGASSNILLLFEDGLLTGFMEMADKVPQFVRAEILDLLGKKIQEAEGEPVRIVNCKEIRDQWQKFVGMRVYYKPEV